MSAWCLTSCLLQERCQAGTLRVLRCSHVLQAAVLRMTSYLKNAMRNPMEPQLAQSAGLPDRLVTPMQAWPARFRSFKACRRQVSLGSLRPMSGS